jgi:hypothetical protein
VRRILFLSLLSVCLFGCASTDDPEPFAGPEIETTVRIRAGSTLEGPTAVAALPDASEFRRVSVRLIALARTDPEALEPLLDHATLVLRRNDETPFRPAPRLLRTTRVAFGAQARDELLARMQEGDFGGFDPIVSRVGVFAPGTTAMFEFAAVDRPDGEREGIRIALGGSSDGPSFRIALSIDRVVPPIPPLRSSTVATDEADPGALAEEMRRNRLEDESVAALVRETVVLEPPADSLPVALSILFTSPLPGEGGPSIIAIVEVEEAPAPGSPDHEAHRMRVAMLREEQKDQAATAIGGRILSPIQKPVWSGIDSALAGLDEEDGRRNALAWIGRATKARITEDLALTVKDESIDLIAEAIVAAAAELPRPIDPEDMGILCERVCGGLLLRYATRRDPPPGIDSILLRHTGEVGRHAAMLEETLAEAKSVAAFRERLVEENLLFLEDSSPATRVRAFDWLSLEGRAPDGYAPLDDRRKRRKALEAWFESRSSGGER